MEAKTRFTTIEYFYPDRPDELFMAACAIGFDSFDQCNEWLDEGILFYFRDEVEFEGCFSVDGHLGIGFADFCIVREVD